MSPTSSEACDGVPGLERVSFELPRRRLLEPDQRRQRWPIHRRRPAAPSPRRRDRRRRRCRPAWRGAHPPGDASRCSTNGNVPVFSSHDDAVVRLQDEVVEAVAVREQHVEVAVLVEVDQLDAGRAPVRVRPLVDRLRRELAVATVEERHHRLVLLREQDDDVRLAVAVQVGRRHVDRAGARIEHTRHEHRRLPVHRAVLEQRHVPVNRQPKLPTTMSRSPSPSKSAARASEVRGSLVAIGTVTND